MNEQLYINNIYIPLSKSINPSITRSIADIQEPNKRKSTYSKTTTIPNSKEAFEVFGAIFEINLADGTFNPTVKADCLYLVDGSKIIDGYCQLKKITETDDKEIEYAIVMFGNVANLFNGIDDKYLHDLDLSQWNHPFDQDVQVDSWDTQVWDNSIPGYVPFALGTGYVYALVDYGFSSDSVNFHMNEIGVSLYVKVYWDKIFEDAGFTYTSTFLGTDAFKGLIIPSSPETFSLTSAQIVAREFSGNTPNFTSTGTVTTGNLNKITFGTSDVIIFTADVSDPTGLLNNGDGTYTVAQGGYYNISALLDYQATFTPVTQPAKLVAKVKVKTRIVLNGTILLDETQAHITRASAVPTSDYPYTTSAVPTYPDGDYVDITGGIRNYNPPDRILTSVSGVFLEAGDTVQVIATAGFIKNPFQTTHFDSGDGEATLTCSVGAFFNKVANTTLVQGDQFVVNSAIPLGYKQKDFIMSIVKMFNLYIDVDPNSPKNLIIEPRDDFYGGDIVNIEDKVAIDRGIELIPMGGMNARRYIYKYKSDKDYWNQTYESNYQETYGEREVTILNEFVQKDEKTELIFSPTPMVGLPGNDRILPTIIAQDDLGQPIKTKSNIRILYYGGLIDNFQNWQHAETVAWYLPDLVTARTQYPYAGHFDHPYTPTLDINFGLVKELYYDSVLNPIVWTNNNLYNKYWSKFINEITDRDSKLVNCWVNLSHYDFNSWSFQDSYFFNNAYHRLNKISGFNPTNQELTKIEFIKIKQSPIFVPVDNTTTGAPEGIGFPPPNVDDGETAPVFGDSGSKSNFNPDNNNFNVRNNQDISGSNNKISYGAKSVCIKGSGNFIGESNDIELFNSNNNVIDSGLTNVTLINTNNRTITESNVTYINGTNMSTVIQGATMKLITTKDSQHLNNYSFEPAKQKVTILERFDIIQYIINQTDGIIIYNPTDEELKGAVHSNEIILNYDTTAMNVNDKLIIVAEVENILEKDTNNEINNIKEELKELNKQINKIRN